MSQTWTSRQQVLQAELKRILPILREHYQPEKIILFGSFAHGRGGPWSDLDIAIIKKTNKRFLDRTLEVARLVGSQVATDFVVYTPEELKTMTQHNYFVRDEIVNRGVVLYDKTKSS